MMRPQRERFPRPRITSNEEEQAGNLKVTCFCKGSTWMANGFDVSGLEFKATNVKYTFYTPPIGLNRNRSKTFQNVVTAELGQGYS